MTEPSAPSPAGVPDSGGGNVPAGWGAAPPAYGARQAPAGPGWGPAPSWTPADVKPGVIPLRPLSVMEIMDGSISTLRAHPGIVVGLSAGVVAVATAVRTTVAVTALSTPFGDLTDANTADSGYSSDLIGSLVAGGITYVLVTAAVTLVSQVFLSGMLTSLVGKAVLGQPCDVSSVWRQVRPRLLALLLTTGAVALLLGVVWSAAAAAVVLAGLSDVGWAGAANAALVAILVTPAAVVLTLWVTTWASVASPVVVLERAGVFTALRRSRRLVRGSFWRVLGVLLLVQLISTVLSGVLTVPVGFLSAAAGAATGDAGNSFALVPQLIQAVGAILVGTITLPFVCGCRALLYLDLRMRREGLDLVLHRAAGMSTGMSTGMATPPTAGA